MNQQLFNPLIGPLQAILCCILLFGCATYKLVSPDYASRGDTYILKVPYIEQKHNNCCGLFCLAMVISYWRDEVVPVDSLSDLNCPQSGFSGEELQKIAEQNDFHAYILKGDIKGLYHHLNATRPLIVMLEQNNPFGFAGRIFRDQSHQIRHYSIVVGYSKIEQDVILMDPARGLVRIGETEFLGAWEKAHLFTLLIVPQ